MEQQQPSVMRRDDGFSRTKPTGQKGCGSKVERMWVPGILFRFSGFPSGSDGNKSAFNAEDLSYILGSGRSLEKSRATHSRILAWRIPWTEEPGRLLSMGSQSDTTE